MRPYKRCLVIGHTDGHGAVATAISKKNLEKECEVVDILARFPDTGIIPKFWSETIDEVNPSEYDKIVIVDIPIDARNPDLSIEKLSRLCRATLTHFIDHHPTLTPEATERLVEAGCIVERHKSSYDTVYGPPDPKWNLIGAISDRDPYIINTLEERHDKNKLLELADGLDVAVRKDLTKAIKAILVNDEGFFLEQAREVPDPVDIDVEGPVAIVGDRVPEGWIFKVLDKACRKTGATYGAYLQENAKDRATGEPIDQLFLIKYWMAKDRSARDMLPEELKKRAIGHPDAQRIILEPGTGKDTLKKLLTTIAKK